MWFSLGCLLKYKNLYAFKGTGVKNIWSIKDKKELNCCIRGSDSRR